VFIRSVLLPLRQSRHWEGGARS